MRKLIVPLAGFALALLLGAGFMYAQAHFGEWDHYGVSNEELCNFNVYPEHEGEAFCSPPSNQGNIDVEINSQEEKAVPTTNQPAPEPKADTSKKCRCVCD